MCLFPYFLFILFIYLFTLGPAYNEQFEAQKCAHCSWVLIITEPFNIVVSEMVQAG